MCHEGIALRCRKTMNVRAMVTDNLMVVILTVGVIEMVMVRLEIVAAAKLVERRERERK